MSKVLVSKEKLDTLSETIKTKTNKINNLTIDEMNEAVENIASGDIEINGLTEQYQVYAGENISAGDFVEFINNVTKSVDGSYNCCMDTLSCVLLDENKVFITTSGNNRKLYGYIVTIDGTTLTYNKRADLNSTSNSSYRGTSCVLLEENKVFIAHCYDSSNKYLYGTIVEIDGTNMTATSAQFTADANSCYYTPHCVLLEPNKVFIAHCYDSSNKYLYGTIVTIDGTNMTATSVQLNADANSCIENTPYCVLLEENKVFIAHRYSGNYLYGTIVEIDGTNMTATSAQLTADTNSCTGAPYCILLEENKVFIVHRSSFSYYLYGTIVTIDGTNMTATSAQFTADANSCYYTPHCVLLEPNKVFIAHMKYDGSKRLPYKTIVTINETSMTADTKPLPKGNNVLTSYYEQSNCILLEENKVIFFVRDSYNGTLGGTIYVGDCVKSYESNIFGVAKSNGAGGDIIDVVVPNT